jgi:hypothetical protein
LEFAGHQDYYIGRPSHGEPQMIHLLKCSDGFGLVVAFILAKDPGQ